MPLARMTTPPSSASEGLLCLPSNKPFASISPFPASLTDTSHQYQNKALITPLFSHSYTHLCTVRIVNSFRFNRFRTLSENTGGVGVSHRRTSQASLELCNVWKQPATSPGLSLPRYFVTSLLPCLALQACAAPADCAAASNFFVFSRISPLPNTAFPATSKSAPARTTSAIVSSATPPSTSIR